LRWHVRNGAFLSPPIPLPLTKVGANGTLKSSAFWTNTTGKAHDKDDRIIYDKDSGVLYYDADGSGKGAAVVFVTIAKKLAMTNKDFYVI
jgi:Ca2+-binding RTX toxin-like protein